MKRWCQNKPYTPNSKSPTDNSPRIRAKLWKNFEKKLKSDTSVVILQDDESRSFVILNHEDYLEKCMDQINNSSHQLPKKILLPSQEIETIKGSERPQVQW